MKKTILTTTLILGLGAASITADQDAEASEQSINHGELAQKAQSNSNELNNAPLHEGEYDYNFNYNNVDYNFSSDGTNYSWEYNGYNNEQVQEVSEPVQYDVQEEQVAEPVQNTEPVQQETQEAEVESVEPVQNTEETSQPAAPTASSSNDGSVKEQFLAAGGTDAMWESIVMPESSGDPNAVNELGYQGLGQTKESWGTGSVQEQTEGMLNYAEERYGSVDAAMDFRNQNNWW